MGLNPFFQLPVQSIIYGGTSSRYIFNHPAPSTLRGVCAQLLHFLLPFLTPNGTLRLC